jgi:hypothetical protein
LGCDTNRLRGEAAKNIGRPSGCLTQVDSVSGAL